MGAAEKLQYVDRRNAFRANIGNVVAHIDCRNGEAPVMACVWDLSATGACLMVPPDVELPERITLVIEGAIRDARLVWRNWSHAGVCFTPAS